MVNSTRAAVLALANNSCNEMDIVINQGCANVLRYKLPLKKKLQGSFRGSESRRALVTQDVHCLAYS